MSERTTENNAPFNRRTVFALALYLLATLLVASGGYLIYEPLVLLLPGCVLLSDYYLWRYTR